jgi:peptidylprolyl isomerase
MRITGKVKVFAMAAASAAALSACGQGEPPAASSATPAAGSSSAPSTTGSKTFDRECTADDIQVSGEANKRPTITIPDTCAPPKQLVTKDLVAGTGLEAQPGATVQTHYLLVTWSDRKELDSSWDRGQPFPLENVGNAPVIKGWNEGMIGIKEGGRRLLVIPPDKGYGRGGRGIKPNETLVFVVDAVQVA